VNILKELNKTLSQREF